MQPSHSSNSSIYDSNPWKIITRRNLSDSAFASSQSSCSGSFPRECLSHSSEEFYKNNQSPVRSIYRTYLHKEQPFPRPPSNSLSRQSSISNLASEGNKNHVETQKIAQLVFLVKDLLEKFTKLNENVDYLLTRLAESLDQKFANSHVETQKYIKTMFENLAHDVLVSASERARMAELEKSIKEKNQRILNLENKLENAQRLEFENITGSLKTTITSELQTHLSRVHQMTVQMAKQNSSSKLEFEYKIERLHVSIKEIIVNEIDSILKKHLSEFRKDCLKGQSGNLNQLNSVPVKTTTTRPTFDNIFEARESFEHRMLDSNTHSPHFRGTTVKLLPKGMHRSSRDLTKLAMQKPLKSIKRFRNPRSLINTGSKSKPVIWSYRDQCQSTQPSEVSFTSENWDSISEGSSPSYSISLMPVREESPNVTIIDHFKSGLNF